MDKVATRLVKSRQRPGGDGKQVSQASQAKLHGLHCRRPNHIGLFSGHIGRGRRVQMIGVCSGPTEGSPSASPSAYDGVR